MRISLILIILSTLLSCEPAFAGSQTGVGANQNSIYGWFDIFQSNNVQAMCEHGFGAQSAQSFCSYISSSGDTTISSSQGLNVSTAGSSAMYWGNPNITMYRNLKPDAGNTRSLGGVGQEWIGYFSNISTPSVQISATAFAGLGTPNNGTLYFCSDCTLANPCAGGGTGALAKRLNGVWVCN